MLRGGILRSAAVALRAHLLAPQLPAHVGNDAVLEVERLGERSAQRATADLETCFGVDERISEVKPRAAPSQAARWTAPWSCA